MNALVTLIWGLEPPNSKRLSKAVLQALLPVFIFAALMLATDLLLAARQARLNQIYPFNPLDPATGWLRVYQFFNLEMSIAWIGLMILLTIWSFQSRGLRNISLNWPQYRVAGLNRAQLILGAASPNLIGALFFFILHTIALTLQISASLNMGGAVTVNPFIELRWMIYLSAEFVLIGAVILEAALRVTSSRLDDRLLALWGFAAASPLLILLAVDWGQWISFLLGGPFFSLSYEWVVLVVIAEWASWPIRFFWVRRAYLRAMDKLDGLEVALPG